MCYPTVHKLWLLHKHHWSDLNKEPLCSDNIVHSSFVLSVRVLRALPTLPASSPTWAFSRHVQTRAAPPHAHLHTHTHWDKRSGTTTTNTPWTCEGTGRQRGPPPRHFKPGRPLKCIDSYCTKGRKQSLAVMSGWIPLSKYPPICVLGIVENKQWSNLCLHSGRRHSVCEIYANKRYCFCSETHLAWFPCVYCKRRHLQANHSWMDVGGGGPQRPDICNSAGQSTNGKKKTPRYGSRCLTYIGELIPPG